MKNCLLQLLIVWTPVIYSSAMRDHAKLITDPYLTLITNLKRFYNASSIYYVNGNFDENFFLTTALVKSIRKLSRIATFSQVLHYEDMMQLYETAFSDSPRQLFIIPIDSERTLEKFGDFTKQHKLAPHAWFLIFWGKVLPKLRSFCENPGAGTLHLGFDTRMLVKCYDNPKMYEWWSVNSKRKILTNLLFEWDPERGLRAMTQRNLYQRRYDVGGTILKVASVVEHPDALAAKVNGENIAMFTKMMTDLAAQMNFILNFVPSENFYGYYDNTSGKWTGILGKLESNEIDVAVSEMTMTKERVVSFDFTVPLILTRTRLFIKEPGNSDVQWNSYLRAFDGYIWLSLLALIVLSAVLLTLIKIIINKSSCIKGYLIEQYLYVWGIYCQQGLSDFPDASPLRIAYVSIFFSAVVLSAIYSASIISYLTLISPMLPFSSLPEFVEDSSYKLIVIRNSYEHEFFVTSQDRVLRGMYRMMKKSENLPADDIQAFYQVCNERVAYYSNDATVGKLGDKIPCKLAKVPTGRIDNLAFALSKQNPFTEFINYNILRFQDHGLIRRMKEIYFKRNNKQSKDYDSVGIWGITPILTVLIFGTCLSVVVLFIERTHHKIMHTKSIYSIRLASEIPTTNANKCNNVKRSLRRF